MEGLSMRRLVTLVLVLATLTALSYCVIDVASNEDGILANVAVDSRTLTAVWAFTYQGDYVVQSSGILQLSPDIDTVLYGPDHTPTFLGVESNTSTVALILRPNRVGPGLQNASIVATSSMFSGPGTRVQTTVTNYFQTGSIAGIDVSANNAYYIKRTSEFDEIYQTMLNGSSVLLDSFPVSTANSTRQIYFLNQNNDALYINFASNQIALYKINDVCTDTIAIEPSSGHLLATTSHPPLDAVVYLYQTRSGEISLKTANILDCCTSTREVTTIYSFGCTDIQPDGTTLLKTNRALDEAAFTLCNGGECTLQTVSLTNNDTATILDTTTGTFTSLEADESHGRWIWSYALNGTYTIQSDLASAYGMPNQGTTTYTGEGELVDIQVYAADSRVIFLVRNVNTTTSRRRDVESWTLMTATNEDLQNAVVLDTGSGPAPNGFSLDRVNGYVVYGVSGQCVGFEIRAVRIPGATTTVNLSGGDNNYKSSAVTEMQGNQVTINLYFSGLLNGLSECL
eukprot:TRINITY_DN12095_c0_g1_i1.p1 TRINITY_DN12095_c0_g1~~TRINITY_DN12095_c0_g1_i1.p1  ORF type:complete len:512 (-),score=95.88 TRINITY_DN12095_c0_g1_i1:80-1615(-)